MNRKIRKNLRYLENKEVDESPLGFLISNVAKDYHSYLTTYLEKIELSPPQIYYLLALKENNYVSQEYLASLLNISEGTVAKLTRTLEKENLIKRDIDKQDKRKKVVKITSDGKEHVIKFNEIIKGFESDLRTDFTEEELFILRILLKKMSNHLSKSK